MTGQEAAVAVAIIVFLAVVLLLVFVRLVLSA